mmetsp:Transcript_77242/g.151285  ORF Transcript_77242/g.151285 Transcript_77242/m.151285 type:complete len:253 (-) Transcript_77242:81-839(-)
MGSTRSSSRICSRTKGWTTTFAMSLSTLSFKFRVVHDASSAMIGSVPSAGTMAILPSSVVVMAMSAPHAADCTAVSGYLGEPPSGSNPTRSGTAPPLMASCLAASVKHRKVSVVAASLRTSADFELRSAMQVRTPPAPSTSSSPDCSRMQLYKSLSTRGWTLGSSMEALPTSVDGYLAAITLCRQGRVPRVKFTNAVYKFALTLTSMSSIPGTTSIAEFSSSIAFLPFASIATIDRARVANSFVGGSSLFAI